MVNNIEYCNTIFLIITIYWNFAMVIVIFISIAIYWYVAIFIAIYWNVCNIYCNILQYCNIYCNILQYIAIFYNIVIIITIYTSQTITFQQMHYTRTSYLWLVFISEKEMTLITNVLQKIYKLTSRVRWQVKMTVKIQ